MNTLLLFAVAISSLAVKPLPPHRSGLNHKASLVDVIARRAELRKSRDPRVLRAVGSIGSCIASRSVEPPSGVATIASYYFNGTDGATNPQYFRDVAPFEGFEHRVSAGMNQFLASGDESEASCAQQQIHKWAQAAALLQYDPKANAQGWHQVEWTLGSIAISESVLVSDSHLDPAAVAEDIAWMNKVAHKLVDVEKQTGQSNNLHYWTGLAAVAVGVVSADRSLFDWGVGAFKEGVNSLNSAGAFPAEMARNELAIHYQAFALQALIPLAELAKRQGVDLYTYASPSGVKIADAINFLAEASANPSRVKPFQTAPQKLEFNIPDVYAALEFYLHRYPQTASPNVRKLLDKPTYADRIGGSTTVLAGPA